MKKIAVSKQYPGVGISLMASIKNTRTPFSIDLGVGDIVVPGCEKREIPTQLTGFRSPVVNTYSIETTIAEKIDAILDLMEFSSRMKDYYDIYYLSNKFNFNGTVLTAALNKTFSNREHFFSLNQFNQIREYASDESMQRKWQSFIRKIEINLDFDSVLQTIIIFLSGPIKAVFEDAEYDKEWKAHSGKWY